MKITSIRMVTLKTKIKKHLIFQMEEPLSKRIMEQRKGFIKKLQKKVVMKIKYI